MLRANKKNKRVIKDRRMAILSRRIYVYIYYIIHITYYIYILQATLYYIYYILEEIKHVL